MPTDRNWNFTAGYNFSPIYTNGPGRNKVQYGTDSGRADLQGIFQKHGSMHDLGND